MFSGTGIRDSIEGGYLKLDKLGISPILENRINSWLSRYAEAHFAQYADDIEVQYLDNEGIEVCKLLREELPDTKIEYYSNAKMEKIIR